MELHEDDAPDAAALSTDSDLRDDRAPSASRRWVFGAIVALDLLAIGAFLTYVVIPKLT